MNTYAYVGGNPLIRFDFFGLACNARSCYPTDAETAAANNGDWANYYALACAGEPRREFWRLSCVSGVPPVRVGSFNTPNFLYVS